MIEMHMLTTYRHSLEKEPSRRATPWRMLDHPWMVEMRSKRVNIPKYLSKVWGWEEPVADGPEEGTGTIGPGLS